MKSTRIPFFSSVLQFAILLLCFAFYVIAGAANVSFAVESDLANILRGYSAGVLQDEELLEAYKGQTNRYLRSRRDEANRKDLEQWRAIKGREDWEALREHRLEQLRVSLG